MASVPVLINQREAHGETTGTDFLSLSSVMQVDVGFALLLTTLAGLSTGIGSAIAYFIRTPKYSYLAIMLGVSAGVMIYISFAELLKTAIDQVGFATANLGFFVGIAFIAVVDTLVPHDCFLI